MKRRARRNITRTGTIESRLVAISGPQARFVPSRSADVAMPVASCLFVKGWPRDRYSGDELPTIYLDLFRSRTFE